MGKERSSEEPRQARCSEGEEGTEPGWGGLAHAWRSEEEGEGHSGGDPAQRGGKERAAAGFGLCALCFQSSLVRAVLLEEGEGGEGCLKGPRGFYLFLPPL